MALALSGSRFEDDDHRDDDEPQDEQGPSGVLLALDEIDRQLGAGVATPNHVVTVSPVVPCMAHEAEEVPLGIEPEPGPCPGHGGAGVRIFVADTGLVDGAEADHAWMAGVRGDLDPDPAAVPPGHDPDDLLPYAGHGTFVTGVLRCAAPAAEIYCANVFNLAGSALEADAVPKLDRALDEGHGLFNLTISALTRSSCRSRRSTPGAGGFATAKAWRASWRPGTTAWSSHRPAAFSGMIAVGALAADGRSRASFSNYGSWVDVYARGRGLVNAWGLVRTTATSRPSSGRIATSMAWRGAAARRSRPRS